MSSSKPIYDLSPFHAIMWLCVCTQVAVSGYCYAVSALLGTVRSSKLGLPSAKAREVFNLGQEFVKMGKNAREEENKMALVYINGGWALIGAFITLGN